MTASLSVYNMLAHKVILQCFQTGLDDSIHLAAIITIDGGNRDFEGFVNPFGGDSNGMVVGSKQ